MKYTYNVITPVTRFENLTKLINLLEPMKVNWHVITDTSLGWRPAFPNQRWINQWTCPNTEVEFWKRCNFSINWFLNHFVHTRPESERWCILNDDDAYEADFFEKVDKHDGDLVICSMERGHHTPAGVDPVRAHGFTKLIAAPEYMHPGYVGVEQAIVSGTIIKGTRLPLAPAGDGEWIEWMVANHKAEYAPEANVLFNYFEPGRWDK